ncbi:hypothetical protein ACGFK1_06185 [Mycobacterium sp. NPDC048908]|uniref:hypothetical protein n=1 Tax=Mycobacterium sp. NPDC048908 TaxID=3364292 RepID=UPI0037145801
MTAAPKRSSSLETTTIVRSLAVRKAAARAAVTASRKTGRAVDDRVRKLAESR